LVGLSMNCARYAVRSSVFTIVELGASAVGVFWDAFW
jgi:hypothetical protein